MSEEMKVNFSNRIKKSALRRVQLSVLEECAEVVGKTAGPFGSHTMIMKEDQLTSYTKDGISVLKNFHYFNELEEKIRCELEEVSRHVVRTCGDGTTTAVQLSYLIYKGLLDHESDWTKAGYSPYQITNAFKTVVDNIKEAIRESARKLTTDDIMDICLTSTNGNEEISKDLTDIYKKFGNDVFIQVGTSNTTSSVLKTYDGIILNKGYASPAFVNTKENTCVIDEPRIYYFADPVDTPEMMQLFLGIIDKNFFEPYSKNDPASFVPTVILVPSLSQDLSNKMADLDKIFYAYDQHNMRDVKPPLCIITGLNDRVDNIEDITILCNCPKIKKYINKSQREADIASGAAPSYETVVDFYGTCDQIAIDTDKAKIYNPSEMFDKNAEIAEDGSRPFSNTYKSLVNFLKAQIEIEERDKTDLKELAQLNKRYHYLASNFVEYLVGGISPSDRENAKDLVEDAVLNCRSASINGVGSGAGIEGYCAAYDVRYDYCHFGLSEQEKTLELDICNIIVCAYEQLILNLYMTAMGKEKAAKLVVESLEQHKAYNLREESFDGKQVLSSIETDEVILDAISKIITMMYTTNQAFASSAIKNKYLDFENKEQ